MNTPVCNSNCICIDSDCSFFHLPTFKDRKIIKNLFDALPVCSKAEVNAGSRKANCRFGQLCFNADCGFRHRLCVPDRHKLIKAFNDFKLTDIKVEKQPKHTPIKTFNIKSVNSFDFLVDDSTELTNTPPPSPPAWPSLTHSILPAPVIKTPPEIKSWADMFDNDEDFYMKF